MRKTVLGVLVLVFVMCVFALGAALAEESGDKAAFDFLAFAKERVLPDFHPTVKTEEAEVNFDEQPYNKGEGVMRAKVGIYYKGWMRQHSMLVEMDYREEDRKVRVTVLKDTNGLNLTGARFFREGEWVSLAAVGWK